MFAIIGSFIVSELLSAPTTPPKIITAVPDLIESMKEKVREQKAPKVDRKKYDQVTNSIRHRYFSKST